jgi:branched-chain amino acid transport system permease protein
MSLDAALVQALNGVQYGFLLFLVASGLTLVFGIMGVINLAHGAFYMLGAYLAFWLAGETGSLLAAVMLGVPLMLLLGLIIERLAISFLYERDHLQQVLLTFGLILIIDDVQQMLWGTGFHGVAPPTALAGSIPLTADQDYPVYRLFISAVCLLVAAGLYGLIARTRIGMAIRAGAADRETAEALGVDVRRLFTLVFALGIGLAAFAGMIGAPVSSVYPGMGDRILIVSFVVVVIGGIGSVKGAFVGAMLIGLADTFGKVLLPEVASMVIYALMAAVLMVRPQGLFGRAA